MDFKFYNKVSIRGFTSVFTIIDSKTRKLWVFPGPDKPPPIHKLNYFLTTLTKQNIVSLEIRVDEGGELARSTEFCKTLLNNAFHLQTTGGHHYLLNGKIERPHQTIQKMFNAALLDSGHAKNKCCFACEATAEIYNNILHSATK